MVAVPDRLEEAVGEAEGEDVLGRLLAEEVVDAEDLLLLEDLVQLGVERLGAREVGAEGLLHDDPAALDELGLLQLVHDGERRLGRHGQVVQPPRVGPEDRLGLVDGIAEPWGPAVPGTQWIRSANSRRSSSLTSWLECSRTESDARSRNSRGSGRRARSRRAAGPRGAVTRAGAASRAAACAWRGHRWRRRGRRSWQAWTQPASGSPAAGD